VQAGQVFADYAQGKKLRTGKDGDDGGKKGETGDAPP